MPIATDVPRSSRPRPVLRFDRNRLVIAAAFAIDRLTTGSLRSLASARRRAMRAISHASRFEPRKEIRGDGCQGNSGRFLPQNAAFSAGESVSCRVIASLSSRRSEQRPLIRGRGPFAVPRMVSMLGRFAVRRLNCGLNSEHPLGFSDAIVTAPPDTRRKKTDVAEHPQVLDHVGLLVNEPPGRAGLPFI
jgi:hypothetical protein